MSDQSKIEWTDATWNPVTGCTKVSPGCDHCYAETFAERWRGTKGHHFENGFDVQLRPERLDQPLSWKKPRKVFVNSMSDLFHEKVPDEFIARVFAVMALTPQHTYQLLTKRHGRMRSLLTNPPKNDDGEYEHGAGWLPGAGAKWMVAEALEEIGRDADRRLNEDQWALVDWPAGRLEWPLPNVWLGVSVEDQKWADNRITHLLQTPAAVRFLSAEPLLGPIDLRRVAASATRIDWVIVGGESGPGARPMEEAWARSLVEQCRDYGIAPFVKQMGSVWASDRTVGGKTVRAHGDSKGGDWDYWPADLRVREFPEARVLNGTAS